jgi:hypothetical protein
MLLLPLLLAVATLQDLPKETRMDQQSPPGAAGARQTAASQSASAGGASIFDSLVSIEHIRREIERQPTLSFRVLDPNQPRFHVEIQGYRYKPEQFPQDFVIPRSPVPMPFGGAERYEMMRLTTPPQYWGSAPFTNADLLKMSALTGAYGLAGALIKKGIEASARARQARVHDEVEQELEAIAAHNALVAAGLASGNTKKKAEKKK